VEQNMAGMDTLDRRLGLDRRAGTDRRSGHDATHAVAIVDRRRAERRASERRAIAPGAGAGRALQSPQDDVDPQLACPLCHGHLEYEVLLSWISPAAYTVDTGYCASCSRRFLRTRHTGRYDSMSWAPLCRVCREPVAFVRALDDRRVTVYHCPMHAEAVWEYDTVTDAWKVRA
jgi:hypothetical protein